MWYGKRRFRILDLETPLEKFFSALVVVGLAAVLAGLWVSLDKRPALSSEHCQQAVLAGVVLAALGFWFRSLTDEHYELDMVERQLHFVSRVGKLSRLRLVADLDDVVALGVSGTPRADRTHRWWTYQVYAVLPSKLVRLTDDLEYQPAVTWAKEMGKATRIPVHPPVPDRQLILEGREPGSDGLYDPYQSKHSVHLLAFFLVAVATVAISFYLIPTFDLIP